MIDFVLSCVSKACAWMYGKKSKQLDNELNFLIR